MKALTAIVLSAGKGTRMVSRQQKTLHPVYEKPMLLRVLDAVAPYLQQDPIVVTGFGHESVEALLAEKNVRLVKQEIISGSADAVRCALPLIENENGAVLIVYGCEAMLTEAAVAAMLDAGAEKSGARIAARGAFLVSLETLRTVLMQDVHDLDEAFADLDLAVLPQDLLGGASVCTRVDLSVCEQQLRMRKIESLQYAGVTMLDPARVLIGPDVVIGADTVLYPDVTLVGKTTIGSGVTLLPGCYIKDTIVGDDCTFVYVHANEAKIGNRVTIGPYVNLRPKTVLADGIKIGDFVEIKNANIGEGTKVPHLTYVGDADVGARVNIGCGSVFVNYNGFKKSRTTVGDDVFLGCQTNLVAPVSVGDGAFTAAGSTITEDVPAGNLSVARARQVNKDGWVAAYRKRNGK